MPVKNATKSARAVRYVLSADSRLRRLSLRKLSERVNKAKSETRSNRSKSSAGAKKSTPSSWGMSARAVVVGVVCVLAAAALITARQPSSPTDVATAGAAAANGSPENVLPAARLETTKPVASLASRTTPDARPNAANVSAGRTPAVVSVKPAAVESAAKTAAPKPAAETKDAAPITVTGCLELDGQTFQLQDTSGADTPKLRSWRSGFLKKRPSAIEVIDPSTSLKLRSYVGQRVAVTGTLVKREMRARSLRRVAGSCS